MRFNLDAFPLTDDLRLVNDYSGVLVYSAISDPLFKYDGTKIIPNACYKWKISLNGKKYTFLLRDDLYAADGSKIAATDYKVVIDSILDGHDRQKYLINNIAEIAAVDNILTIRLEKPDRQFYKVLSKINFSPVSGLYSLKKCAHNTILLTPNKHHRLYSCRLQNLEFILVSDQNEDIRTFKCGDTDFTCNTHFHHKYLNGCSENLHFYQNFIICSLAFINPELLLPKYLSIRRLIKSSVNKYEISQALKNIIIPTDNYFIQNSPMYKDKCSPNISIMAKLSKILTLGYDNFYPNKFIAQIIKRQLDKIGIKVKLVTDDYYNPKHNYDIKIMLSYPDYIDDIAFYKSQYTKTLAKISKSYKYDSMLNKLSKRRVSASTLNKLNKIILSNVLIIPLFKFNSVYLSRNLEFDFRKMNYDSLI
jgi:MarR-like DNA-binding transcriptional regulator SgrR of sgrS sRNA